MIRRRHLWSIFLPVLLLPVHALACPAGRVFEDRNGDGRWQPGEPGIAGVAVSDGSGIAYSNDEGIFDGLQYDRVTAVFVVKPAGYRLAQRAGHLPLFWRRGGAHAGTGPESDCDWALRPESGSDGDLEVLVFSDPQVGNLKEIDYFARDVVATARARDDAVLGLTLGDLVNDATDLYPVLNRVVATLGVPWLNAPGNHDLDADATDDAGSLAAFSRIYGPDTFAWEERNAAFVLLDNVVAMPGQRPAYVGGLREEQFAFLQQYLDRLGKERLLVVASHIPWFDTAAPGRPATVRVADRERLFALLTPFPNVLLLSGHRHTQQQYFHGAESGWHGTRPLHEYNVGAASGAFWSGVKDADGIPDTTMADGTPNGFATLTVAPDASYRLAWHPARLPADDPAFTAHMALHAPKLLRRGAYPAWGVYANVFMGHARTRVEYRIGEGGWKPMTRVVAPDPRLLVENVRDDLAETLRGFDRSPEAEPSQHLWRGALATDLAAGEHEVEVRAFDDQGGEHRARVRYELVDAQAD